MVEVEMLRLAPQDHSDQPDQYERQALFHVTADGRVDVLKGQAVVEEVLRVRVVDPATRAFVGVEDDALVWARNLPTAFRTPYLVSVIRELDDADPRH